MLPTEAWLLHIKYAVQILPRWTKDVLSSNHWLGSPILNFYFIYPSLKATRWSFMEFSKGGGEKQRWRRNNENNFCSWEEVFCANPEFRVIFYWPHSKLFQVQASNGSADTRSVSALQTEWYSKRGWSHSLSYTTRPFLSNSASYFGSSSYNNVPSW